MEEKTQNLLNDENCDQNQSIRGKKELIVKYITEWSQIWSRRASKDEKELSAFSSDKETRKSQREIQLYKDDVILGAHMSDALLHLLLDIKETELNELFPQKPKKKQELSDSLERICNNVITGWARSMDPQNALKAETILKRMEFLYDYYSLVEIRPSICTYTSVMDAWSKSQDPLAGKYAEDILIRMKETNIFAHEGSEKDALVMATNTVINAYSQKGNLEAAERLLGDMEKPDVYSYTTVIQAYNTSASPKNKSAKNAEKHLQTMYQLYKSTRNDKIRPNSITFHTVMSCYVKSKLVDDAERILQWMILLSKDEIFVDLQPSHIDFGLVMNAYTKQKQGIQSAKKVQKLFDQMFHMYQTTHKKQLKPNYQSFVICMDAWAKSKAPNAAIISENMLNQMEELYAKDSNNLKLLNNYGYNLVIDAWSKSGEKGAAQKAEMILQRMNDMFDKTQNTAILPDKISYTAVMKAWVNSRETDFAEKCALLLSKMEQLYEETHDSKVKPDTIAYANVIDAFAKAGKPHLSEVVLKRLESFSDDKDRQPNTACYNILMNAYGKSGFIEKCEKLLEKMETLSSASKTNVMQPNHITYTTFLDALAHYEGNAKNYNQNDSRVKKAEDVLTRMILRYKEHGQHNAKPSEHTWNTIIFIYAKSKKLPRKFLGALDVFRRMEKFGAKPNIVTYNSLLNSCNFVPVQEREMALHTALTLFESLHGNNNKYGVKADSTTYKSIMNICHVSPSPVNEKKMMFRDIFKKCCQDGRVNNIILSILRKSVPDELYWELLELEERSTDVLVSDLPMEWSCNANKKRMYNQSK